MPELKQHETKETNSPEIKAARTEILEERVEETITVLKGDFENLQDLLVQSGQDNEKLKIQMKETNEKASADAAKKESSMELHDIITNQNHKMNVMKQESIKLVEEKKFFKEEAEKAVQATHRLNAYISTLVIELKNASEHNQNSQLENNVKCDQCDKEVKNNTELVKHNVEKHIHDTWPNSCTKRDSSMVKTSSISEPKKKKIAGECERKEMNHDIQTNKMSTNVKELPPLIKCKYPDSKEFCVTGDGACCLNCLAAWICLDPSQGPVLGRDMNTHIAEYRPYYKEKLAFPLTITIAGGKRVVCKEGEEDKFFDTLVSSREASYIWRESHDMVALANFTQMDVEVVVYDQKTGIVEEPNQLYKPDPNFPWKKEDANAPNDNKYEKMVLLNYKNCHFNLIIKESHPLAKLDGQSIRQKEVVDEVTIDNTIKYSEDIQKVNSDIWMFPCSKCNISFDSRNTMMKHMKNKHLNEYVKVIETKLKEAEKENITDVETSKVGTASELENNNERFSFSQVKAYDKCEAVFVSDILLKDHINNNHIENIDVEMIDHTPMENIAQKKQLHCAIIDTPGCQFQCETNNEMQHHIKVKHRSKPQLQCNV